MFESVIAATARPASPKKIVACGTAPSGKYRARTVRIRSA
jgi:hypothetical protein